MKKIVVILMCTVLATSLVACIKTPDTSSSSGDIGNNSVSDTAVDDTLGDGIDDITGDPTTITDVGTKEEILLNTDDYRIILDEKEAQYVKKETGQYDGMLFSFTIENNTDQKVSFCFKNIKINGEEMLLTEAAALTQRYGTETSANDSTFAGLLVPFQSLYASEISTIESISFVAEIYPVVGQYGELGELLYTSEELTFHPIPGYTEDDDWDDEEDEDEDDGYTYTEVTIEEQVLVDDDLLKISTTGDITYEEGYAQRIGLAIENKTDSDLMINSRYIAVNGYTQTTYLFFSVPAGETLDTSIDLFYYDLMMCNIDTIATVEFAFELGMLDTISYGPITIETSAADYEQPFDFDGTTVYNENGIEVIALDEISELYDFVGPVFIFINNTGADIRTNFENVTINGISVSNEGESHLPSGMYSIRLLDYSDDMYDNNIDSIDEFACELTIYGENFEILADGEPISIAY